MTIDRRVHARDRYVEVVRYERAGKWYIEPLHDGRKRERVTVEAAARRASVCPKWDGEVCFGVPGGATFDRKVRIEQERVPEILPDAAA